MLTFFQKRRRVTSAPMFVSKFDQQTQMPYGWSAREEDQDELRHGEKQWPNQKHGAHDGEQCR